MRIPKTLTLKCVCEAERVVELTLDQYTAVALGQVHMDFAFCQTCQSPIAFELPQGLAKRNPDRYSAMTIVAAPLKMAS